MLQQEFGKMFFAISKPRSLTVETSTMIDQIAKQLISDIQSVLQNNNTKEGTSPSGENDARDIPSLDSSQLKPLIESALKKLNLVSREEFDAQQAVLLRTREKLEALEQKLETLESDN